MKKSENKDKLIKLLNLLSFKLQHKDYVVVYSMLYNLRVGNLSQEEMIELYKEVAHIEYEFSNYSTFSVIKGGKNKCK